MKEKNLITRDLMKLLLHFYYSQFYRDSEIDL